jgi:hypothetical protein
MKQGYTRNAAGWSGFPVRIVERMNEPYRIDMDIRLES